MYLNVKLWGPSSHYAVPPTPVPPLKACVSYLWKQYMHIRITVHGPIQGSPFTHVHFQVNSFSTLIPTILLLLHQTCFNHGWLLPYPLQTKHRQSL